MLDKLKDRIKSINRKYLFINLVVVAIGILVIGYVVRLVLSNFGAFISDEPFIFTSISVISSTFAIAVSPFSILQKYISREVPRR